MSIGIDKNKIVHLPNTVDLDKINKTLNLNKKTDFKKLKLITVARYDKNVKGYNQVEIVAKKLFENDVNFLFAANMNDIVKYKTKFGKLIENSQMDIRNRIFELTRIRSLKVTRRRVKNILGYNKLGSFEKPEERFDDTTHNDQPADDALQFLNKKVDECIDSINTNIY